MTPERDASEIVAGWLALFMPYETKPTVTLRHVLEARIADALRAERERAERAEAATKAHELDLAAYIEAEAEIGRLTREVERSRETLLEWQKRDGKLVYDDEDNGPTLCVCEWAADREAVLRAGHGHVCTLVRAALTVSTPEDGVAKVEALTREVERLAAALSWVLGAGDEFKPRGLDDPLYWWRAELQRRAGLVWDGEQFVIPPAPEGG